MTREEAIQILSTRDAHGVMCGYTGGYTEALDIALESLQRDIERQEMIIRASEKYLGIVRCKDCIHYRSDGGALMVCDVSDMVVNDTDYCSYGEREEE